MTDALLEQLLVRAPHAEPTPEVAAWWSRHRVLAAAWPRTIEQAIVGGWQADRVAWAFASGYQAALRALVPDLPADTVCALCVTEAQGTAPRAMQTRLLAGPGGRLRLTGDKRWATLGPDGGLFLVAARDLRGNPDPAARPVIRLVRVGAGSAGLHLETLPPTGFVPEVPHASLRLEDVDIDGGDVLPGDGYAGYVKPFRSIEDLHVHAAVLACLLREARRLRWSRAWVERATAALLAMRELAAHDPDAATTHVALAGVLAAGAQLAGEADAQWPAGDPDPDAAARWQRDRRLLDVAGQARSARILRAWDRLPGTATGER